MFWQAVCRSPADYRFHRDLLQQAYRLGELELLVIHATLSVDRSSVVTKSVDLTFSTHPGRPLMVTSIYVLKVFLRV